MVIEFPHGHAYDFERLCAGVTALLGRNADIKAENGYTWKPAGGLPSLSIPPGLRAVFTCSAIMTVRAYSSSHASAALFSGGGYGEYQIQIYRDKECIKVYISHGSLDPANEVIGFWRYGSPKILETFELK